ncbi:TfuA-like protein [Granulicella sibirica]|uniref:TfuA-like core domain-containing protein n=1 Tax=Granulicella sibirica TaxID=2479048 RepID=A0A4V1L5R6_9BACT|nr:TfuA-like protein [Granulicella sibirica]RXH56694.1 hypothetical protein GRAN_3551 [Granulicella sibirica]
MYKTAVFLGPSLDVAIAKSILDALFLPPIKRGDLQQLPEGICNIGIIDGEFFQSLAVSPKEILTLLDRGSKVFGSSSMGALRAAETEPYGMVGIGKIFERYRDGGIDADDEVALTYDPVSYRPLSEALVNIRFVLEAAVLENVITQPVAMQVIRELQEVNFPFRSYAIVCDICPQLRNFLNNRCLNQKRDDAILLLQTLAHMN